MTKRKSHDAVTVEIAASPAEVYALVSDITRMGEWSPECVQCTWTKGATGPSVGARFKAKNKGGRGPAWGNTPTVTAADPGLDHDPILPPAGVLQPQRHLRRPRPGAGDTAHRGGEQLEVRVPNPGDVAAVGDEIGRASCRERV